MRDYGSATPLLSGGHFVHAHLIEYETETGTIRYNTSGWDLEWDDETWLAGHGVIQLAIADEGVNLEVHGSSITIAALNPAVTSQALSQNNRGRYCAVYEAVLDPDTYQIKGDSREWSGRLSNVQLNKPATEGL